MGRGGRDREMDGLRHGWMEGRMDTGRGMDRGKDGQREVWTAGWIEGRMDRGRDGQRAGWI
jgi:hypothetical protein